MKFNETKNNNFKNKYITFLIIVLIIITLTIIFIVNNNNNNENLLNNFKIENTCWMEPEKKDTLFCFGTDTVYSVDKINGEFRATSYDIDTNTLEKKNEIEGKFTNNKYKDIIYGYIVQVNKNNSLVLWTTYYDAIEDKSINKEYPLSEIKLSDVTFSEDRIQVSILGNYTTIDLSNTYIKVNSKLPLYSILNTIDIDIKDKYGNITNKQGYKFIYDISANGNLYYMKKSDYDHYLKEEAYPIIYENKLCYKVNNNEKDSNFNNKLNQDTKSLIVHYCSKIDDIILPETNDDTVKENNQDNKELLDKVPHGYKLYTYEANFDSTFGNSITTNSNLDIYLLYRDSKSIYYTLFCKDIKVIDKVEENDKILLYLSLPDSDYKYIENIKTNKNTHIITIPTNEKGTFESVLNQTEDLTKITKKEMKEHLHQ